MTFTLTIQCDNAAFGDDDPDARRDEVARILQALGARLNSGSEERGRLTDVNGNRVGAYEFQEVEAD